MHGDQGDDQHGLKVHEVHDMQPGLPSSAQHQVNLESGNSAAGNALHIGAQQLGAPTQAAISPAPLADTSASAVVADAAVTVQKATLMSTCEESGQEGLVSSKEEPSADCVIDLCIPLKPKQQSVQPQHHPELQRDPHLQQSPQLLAVAEHQPAEAFLLPQPCPQSPNLAASDDAFPELQCRFDSRSRAGKATTATLHNLRPAGVEDDHCAHLAPVTQQAKPKQQGQQPEPQGHKAGLQGREHELQGGEPEPQGHESGLQGREHELQGSEPERQGHELEAQGSEPEPQGSDLEPQGRAPDLQGSKAELQGHEPEPQGVCARVKGLLQRQGCGLVGVDGGDGDAAPPLTQAEVIEAQTADEEKPLVCFTPKCCFAVFLPFSHMVLLTVRVLFCSSACVTEICLTMHPRHHPNHAPQASPQPCSPSITPTMPPQHHPNHAP